MVRSEEMKDWHCQFDNRRVGRRQPIQRDTCWDNLATSVTSRYDDGLASGSARCLLATLLIECKYFAGLLMLLHKSLASSLQYAGAQRLEFSLRTRSNVGGQHVFYMGKH